MGSRDHFWASGNFLQICTLGYILKKWAWVYLEFPGQIDENGHFWSFLVSFLAHFGCEIQNGPITMKFYLQVFHSYQTQNILLKYAFLHFLVIFRPFWTIFGPFWVWNPKSSDHHEILFASISLLSDQEYLTKICFFSIFGAFLGHFGCEIQNSQITMKLYLQVFHSHQTQNILLQ